MNTEIPSIYCAHLRAVTTADRDAIAACWEPDGVLEFPYAQSLGTPGRLEGIGEIVAYFTGPKTFDGWSFRDFGGAKAEGAEEYVIEMHGSATLVANGAPYEQDYIVRFGLSQTGRLAWMREFWDPTRPA